MVIKLKDFIKGLLPLSKEKQQKISWLKNFLEKKDFKQAKMLIHQDRAGVFSSPLHLSDQILSENSIPILRPSTDDVELRKVCIHLNNTIKEKLKKRSFRAIAKNPWLLLESFASHIVGLKSAKEATLLQLFSDEPIHILLLGDPGTGKTDILRAVEELAPISSFGLGSGTSGVGLTATFKGSEMIKGLLPQADEGICCIDELNLMKEQDYASLYNAMEKGFVTYDKGSKHVKLDARISVLATANPKGDRFIGKDIKFLKTQMPFDPALLSRFHLVFLVRGPNIDEFRKISEKIVSGKKTKVSKTEIEIIKEYLERAFSLDVTFPKNLQDDVVMFSEHIKKHEKEYLIEVSPRLIHGIVRLAKAHARFHLRSTVQRKDLLKVEEILEKSLDVKN